MFSCLCQPCCDSCTCGCHGPFYQPTTEDLQPGKQNLRIPYLKLDITTEFGRMMGDVLAKRQEEWLLRAFTVLEESVYPVEVNNEGEDAIKEWPPK